MTLDDVLQVAKELEVTDETDVAETQATEIAELVDDITQRLNDKSFPAVRPDECLTVGDAGIEASPYTLASTMEAVEIQSYMDAHWQAYHEANPNDEDFPVQVKRVRWARENYYHLLQSFLQRKTLDSNTFAHRRQGGVFVPLLPVSSASTEENKQDAIDAVQKMIEDDIEEVDKVLWDAWASYLTRFGTPAWDKYACFSAFLKEEYFYILKYKYPSFVPRVPPKMNALPDEVALRQDRLRTMSS